MSSLLAVVAVGPPSAGAAAVDWDTYGFNARRTGFNPRETALVPAQVPSLREKWASDLGGVIDTQPLLASQVDVPTAVPLLTTRKDLVVAGTERGRLAALDAANGAEVWHRELGYVDVPCPALPHYGITGTPVVDRSTDSVYVADGTGKVHDIDLATGDDKRPPWTITLHPKHEHVWSALTLEGGKLYVPIAGNCDRTPYQGQVVSIDIGDGSVNRWYVTGKAGPSGGGIWAWGGVSATPASGAIYAATGNSVTPSQHDGYAENVVRLTSNLTVAASHYPGVASAGGDADFGGTPMLYRGAGCPPQLAVGNKFGSFFVYDRDQIGQGPVQTIPLGSEHGGRLMGVAAYWPDKQLLYLANPKPKAPYVAGILAFKVTSRCRLKLSWQAPGVAALTSSPTVAGGVVYYGDGAAKTIVAFDGLTGEQLWTSGHALNGAIFNAPSVAGGTLYAGSWDGKLHAFAPQ